MTFLNTDFGKYFLFIYLINGSNSLTFLSSKLLTLRFITLLLTVSNNTKHPFHIFFGTFKFLEFHRMRIGSGLGPVWVGFGLWKRTNSRSNGNKGKVGYNTFQRTSVLLFLHFNSTIRLSLQAFTTVACESQVLINSYEKCSPWKCWWRNFDEKCSLFHQNKGQNRVKWIVWGHEQSLLPMACFIYALPLFGRFSMNIALFTYWYILFRKQCLPAIMSELRKSTYYPKI